MKKNFFKKNTILYEFSDNIKNKTLIYAIFDDILKKFSTL